MANWEQRSDRWLDVPIIVKAAGGGKVVVFLGIRSLKFRYTYNYSYRNALNFSFSTEIKYDRDQVSYGTVVTFVGIAYIQTFGEQSDTNHS